jgi:predicted nucleic acid-binding protein
LTVKYWDTSAIVPLLLSEEATAALTAEYDRDPGMLVWWGTDVECVSAIARLERDQPLESATVTTALARLDALAAAWQEVQPTVTVRRIAVRLLRVHPLRAADSLQLAAAIVASESDPSTLQIVTLDGRLAQAADKEGFSLASLGPP